MDFFVDITDISFFVSARSKFFIIESNYQKGVSGISILQTLQYMVQIIIPDSSVHGANHNSGDGGQRQG